jgi:hypothetical protein
VAEHLNKNNLANFVERPNKWGAGAQNKICPHLKFLLKNAILS